VRFLQDRIEQQEKKISLLELGKKGGQDGLLKEIDSLRKKEAKISKLNAKLEEENVELKVKVEASNHNSLILNDTVNEFTQLVQAHQFDEKDTIKDSRTFMDKMAAISQELKRIVQGSGEGGKGKQHSPVKLPPSASTSPVKGGARRLSAELSAVTGELAALKAANTALREAVEVKERKIAEMGLLLQETMRIGMKGGEDAGEKL
jgi:hypothetical protein